MTPFLAARRKDFAATLGHHAHAKSVCFGAAAPPRLKCTLWQSHPPKESAEKLETCHSEGGCYPRNLPLSLWGTEPLPQTTDLPRSRCPSHYELAPQVQTSAALLRPSRQHLELSSVSALRAKRQQTAGYGYRAGKSDTPGTANSGEVLGTGFIISSDGKVATNLHVVEPLRSGGVQLASGERFDSFSILVFDVRKDIAVIKIPGFDLPTLVLGIQTACRLESQCWSWAVRLDCKAL